MLEKIFKKFKVSLSKSKLPPEVDKIIFFCYINNSGLIPASFKLSSFVNL